MKGKLSIVVVLACMLFLLGCGNNQDNFQKESGQKNAQIDGSSPSIKQAQDEAARTKAASLQANSEQESEAKDAKTDYTKAGFALMEKDGAGALRLGVSEAEVLALFSDPDEKSAANIWGADGLEHQDWHYVQRGIELNMIKNKDGRQVVNRILIKSPCDLKTKRGIGIGSTVPEVQNAYKDEINPQDSKVSAKLIAGTIYGGIIFSLKDGIVSSIFIGAAAE